MSEKNVAVKVQDLKKTFRIPVEASNGIKQKFINFLKGKKGYREFTPLNDISFEVEEGDFFGILGRNGSGKSTLLKTLAGIYTPEKGSVTVRGSLVPFIELGVGFNPELSGRENVFLNGALLGFSHDEMETMYDDIVDFAELHDFMEERLKNYSSGMQVRLAFSIAIKAQGDILLLDEVLAVGDEAFQRKCFEYFAKLKKDRKTVILVTHDMNSVLRFCNKAMLIDQGDIVSIGNIKDVVGGYETLNRKEETTSTSSATLDEVTLRNKTNKGFINAGLNGQAKGLIRVSAKKKLVFTLDITPKIDMEDVFLGFTIQKSSGEYVYWYTTEATPEILGTLSKGVKKRVTVSMQNIFGNGEYSVNLSLKKNDRTVDHVIIYDAVKFEVNGWDHANGWMYHPDVEVES